MGEWKDGKKNGHGTLNSASGDIYVGEFKDDEINGHGTLNYVDGAVYVGDWKDANRHGHDTLKMADGKVYFGEWIDNNAHGHGTQKEADGGIYIGEWRYTANFIAMAPTDCSMVKSLLENLMREIVTVGAATSGPMDVYTLENGRMANAMAKELTSIPMDTSIPGMMCSCQLRLTIPNAIFQRMTKYAASVYLDSVEAKRGWCCHVCTDFIRAVQIAGSRRKVRAKSAKHPSYYLLLPNEYYFMPLF